MKTKLIALALFAGSALFAETRFSVNIGVGGYGPVYGPRYARPAYAYAPQPPCPGPGYVWVEGYRGDYRFNRGVSGYWAAPRPAWFRHDYRDDHYNGRYERDRDEYRRR